MHRFLIRLALSLPLILTAPAWAADPGKSGKPIVASEAVSASKPTAGSEEKVEKPPKETVAQKKARLKDERAADELAAKLAESLAEIRKNKPVVKTPPSYAAAAASASVRSRVFVSPSYRANTPSSAQNKSGKDNGSNANSKQLPQSQDWRYDGEAGPANWAKLSPLFGQCAAGERQSPIDIHDGIRVDLDALDFDYKSSRFKVINDSKTIVVTPDSGSYLNLSGRSYALVDFDFHRPGDFSIDGKHAEMMLHLHHKDSDGRIAIVAIMIETGEKHPLIQQVWNNLPLEQNDPVKALNNMDLIKILPEKLTYYTFMGSLTTPPCTEGVQWIVLKQPITISAEQAAIFARLYPMNARPIQPSAGRLIKESN